MPHHCHALGCQRTVPPWLLMCRDHWRMVPPVIQRMVTHYYRKGQCQDKRPSRDWLYVARRAICHVAVQEGRLSQQEADERVERLCERLFRKEHV